MSGMLYVTHWFQELKTWTNDIIQLHYNNALQSNPRSSYQPNYYQKINQKQTNYY